MDVYQQLSSVNLSKQSSLDEIRSINNALNKAEDLLREKITLRYHELDSLKCEYSNIIETYGSIIRFSVHQSQTVPR